VSICAAWELIAQLANADENGGSAENPQQPGLNFYYTDFYPHLYFRRIYNNFLLS